MAHDCTTFDWSVPYYIWFGVDEKDPDDLFFVWEDKKCECDECEESGTDCGGNDDITCRRNCGLTYEDVPLPVREYFEAEAAKLMNDGFTSVEGWVVYRDGEWIFGKEEEHG